jgi:hypothetical protein
MYATRRLVLALCLIVCGRSAAAAQVQHFKIRIDAPARIGLPIWLYADLQSTLEARYPFSSDPRYFGSNRVELKRNGQLLDHLPGFPETERIGGIIESSIAPPDSPHNRLPLHLGFAIDRPGTYSVRWSVVSVGAPRLEPSHVLAESDWLDFNVVQITTREREAWLAATLAARPTGTGLYVGDYIPSLLAAPSDGRVVQAVLNGFYSDDGLIRSCALGTLKNIPGNVTVPAIMESLRRRGPVDGLAYFVSWHEALFQGRHDEIVRIARAYLSSEDDSITEGALRMLLFAHLFASTGNSAAIRDADNAVLAAAPTLAKRVPIAHTLSEYLGVIKSPASRQLLWQQVAHGGSDREQALIALTWIADPADLSRITDLLLQPGNPDPSGRDLASLPYQLVQAYGDAAIPYLQRAMANSPYDWVRPASAEQLSLKGRVESFRFFLDAMTEYHVYRAEVVRWLIETFHLPATANQSEIVAFLNERIRNPQPPTNPSTQR